MKTLLIACLLVSQSASSGNAQSLDDLNIQVHGYVTQGFIYSTHDNWGTTSSSDGSPAWTETVVNLSAQPQAKLRVGVQARYFLLGNLGDSITLDWAQADYKVNEHLGFRAGKVKSPSGMLNETQDVDPSYLWILLPQSVYPLASRNGTLAHFGGVVYGSVALGESLGKLDYRAFGGERVLAPKDGYTQALRDAGLTVPNGLWGHVVGGTVRWNTPAHGLMLGATESTQTSFGNLAAGPYQGTTNVPAFELPYFFGRYERKRFEFAAEYSRLALTPVTQFPGAPAMIAHVDQRSFYAMASYKLTPKLNTGAYYSYSLDRRAAFTSARYQKDWTLCARYDFNAYLYAKANSTSWTAPRSASAAQTIPTPCRPPAWRCSNLA